jgi:pimeloyl-ACP methyl ester carboxylesterase
MKIDPFTIHIPDEQIIDLRRRLKNARWPDAIPGSEWLYGADLRSIREIADYWLNVFDWREQEQKLQALHHYKANIEGHDVHFIHERGEADNALPLLMTHGWPGSFLEFQKILPMLTHPSKFGARRDDSFHVIVPSLMGFGFSERPRQPGANTFWVADIWQQLMTGLGYSQFVVQGGDIGANVSSVLALKYPERVRALHLNYIPGSYSPYLEPEVPLSPAEIAFEKWAAEWNDKHGAYSHVQTQEPETLGMALNDSPIGLAAWIITKFREWSDCNGDVESRFSKDELLANVSLYWFTQTITSSFRLYYEGSKAPLRLASGQRIKPPCGVARFPKELPVPPRERIERAYNVTHWTEMPRGGHFAAAEEPELLAADLREFFRPLRNARI